MRDKIELNKLYEDCMEFWGFEKQARMVQEECAELIIATSHVLRGRENSVKDMIEEIADVYLMLNQMIVYFGEKPIMDVVDFKSNRVRDKLNMYKEKLNENKRN